MKKQHIVVVGSSNTDMVVRTPHLPKGGETVMGDDFLMNAGGKGANQAVAAARLGAPVIFIAKTGNDIFGQRAQEMLAAEGIDCSCMLTDADYASGIALITVDDLAENCIVVAPGANAALLPSDISPFIKTIWDAAIVLIQLEIPLETVEYVADMALEKNIPVILNPAPAQKLPESLLKKLSVITPNETEASVLTGISVTDNASAIRAAESLRKSGVKKVIITLGSKGALLLEDGDPVMISAPVVKPIDTTAAGDVFNGAFAVAMLEKTKMNDSVSFACTAASISVTRMGAQASAPFRREIVSQHGKNSS